MFKVNIQTYPTNREIHREEMEKNQTSHRLSSSIDEKSDSGLSRCKLQCCFIASQDQNGGLMNWDQKYPKHNLKNVFLALNMHL